MYLTTEAEKFEYYLSNEDLIGSPALSIMFLDERGYHDYRNWQYGDGSNPVRRVFKLRRPGIDCDSEDGDEFAEYWMKHWVAYRMSKGYFHQLFLWDESRLREWGFLVPEEMYPGRKTGPWIQPDDFWYSEGLYGPEEESV